MLNHLPDVIFLIHPDNEVLVLVHEDTTSDLKKPARKKFNNKSLDLWTQKEVKDTYWPVVIATSRSQVPLIIKNLKNQKFYAVGKEFKTS